MNLTEKDSAVTWTTDFLAGKPVEVFAPVGQQPRGIVVFLHGYDGVTLRENDIYTKELERLGLACLCPLGPECCWTDRVFDNFDPDVSPIDFLSQQIPDFCQSRWALDTSHIGLTGVELGGQGALQLAYRNARKFSVVAAISPKVDFETWFGHGMSLDQIFSSREAARQATATLHIHPLDWPKHQLLLCDPADVYCFDGVQTLASKLSSTGIPFETDFETSHGGFGWNYANAVAPRVLQYLAAHLG